jgi:thioredoxin 1
MSKLLRVVDSDFERQVLDSPDPVLVSFRASWCRPSQQLAPVIDEIADQFGNQMRFVAVDAEDDSRKIRERTNVARLPVTMLFDGGRSVDLIGGLTSRAAIIKMIKQRLSPVTRADEFNFEVEVLKARLPVLVHFHAAWCKQSQGLVSTVDQFAKEYRGRVKTIRVEFGRETARLCAQFGVSRVPTLSLFINGKIKDQLFGGLIGGTKVGAVKTSCVGLTSFGNIEQMLAPSLKK